MVLKAVLPRFFHIRVTRAPVSPCFLWGFFLKVVRPIFFKKTALIEVMRTPQIRAL